ncbi:MAG: nuclear transport factor 2 family protein [Thaumarchaeota archaeon]|nr:nuclear transport factor 2 family protein [Nitrososphaerota archaeon]
MVGSGSESRNKSVIVEVLTSAYARRDFTALEKWFSPDYIQHNPLIPGKRDGLQNYVKNLPEGRHYEPSMVLAEGNIVMIYGRYVGGAKKTLVGADIFRFEKDLVVEHWDVLQEEVPVERTVAGNPMFTKIEDLPSC